LGEISIHYQTRGPASTVVSGATAGLEALATAMADLAQGRADRALVVASDVATPLAAELTGVAADDGAAALVLERAEDAAARGGTPRARPRAVRSAHGGISGRAVAVELAARAVLAAVERDHVDMVLAAPIDLPVLRGLGADGAAPPWPAGQRAPAALFALIDALAAASDRPGACLLLVAADDENAAAAILDIGP